MPANIAPGLRLNSSRPSVLPSNTCRINPFMMSIMGAVVKRHFDF
jgi:hypothetical protein